MRRVGNGLLTFNKDAILDCGTHPHHEAFEECHERITTRKSESREQAGF